MGVPLLVSSPRTPPEPAPSCCRVLPSRRIAIIIHYTYRIERRKEMKRIVMGLALVAVLLSLSGCIFVDRDDGEGGWRRGHDRHERHEDRR